jgi:hypothetical protein
MTKNAKAWYSGFLSAIVIGGLLIIAGVIVGSYWRAAPSSQVSSSVRRPTVGSTIAISDEQFSAHEETLILALQDGCHYCSDSASFYQRLEHMAQDKSGLHLMIIMPRPDAHDYINKLGLTIGDIKIMPFDGLNIGGTPTLILVDKNSVIRKAWIGKLPGHMEDDVLSTLGLSSQVKCEQCEIK